MGGVRFGVVFTGSADGASWTAFARRVESLGFSTLLVADHYVNPMACGPLLMAAAAATTELRVGSYVYNNDFRPPALLAKEAATIDVLSGGRLELGLGAGWAKPEYVQAGIHFDPPAERAGRFEEAIGIIKALLAGEQVDHRGAHYRLRGLEGSPRPVQQPIPLLIGGGGPRMLRLAAREADIVGFVPRSLPDGGIDGADFAAGTMDERIRRFDTALADAGRSASPPERSVLLFGLDRSPDGVARHLAQWGVDPAEAASSPFALAGDPAEMADTILERQQRWGISYVVCFDQSLATLAPVVARLG